MYRRALDDAQASDSGGGGDEPEHEKLSLDDLKLYFKLLYGKEGQNLLRAFEESEGKLKVEPVGSDTSALDTRNRWRPQQIRIHDELNPAEAAQELMNQLIDASGLTEVRNKLDLTGFDNIETLKISYRRSVARAAGAVGLAAELYLSGISIANEGADWVISINEMSEGNFQAAIGMLPLIPAIVGKTRLRRNVTLSRRGRSQRTGCSRPLN